MRKHNFTKCLSIGIATIVTMTCHSCQPKPVPRSTINNVDCTPSSPCDERRVNRDRNYLEEESNEEAMTHVIEIDQPETSSVTEDQAPATPVMEIPAEAPVEAMSAPAPTFVETTVTDTATTIIETPATDTASSESAAESAETAVLEVQPVDAPNQ